jgi:PAS domain S-box-containing protein
MGPALLPGCRKLRQGKAEMVDSIADAICLEPAQLSERLEEAVNHLPLGIVVFNAKREVVFCNRSYREMYGLSPEQVKLGTPTSDLIRHRLKLGLKVSVAPDDYVRARVGKDIALDTMVQEFTDGRIIAYTVHPVPGGGGMATHEDITEREELHARLKTQYELGGSATSSSTPRSTTCRRGCASSIPTTG